VRLRGVVFAYGPGAAPVLDRLDLAVPAGEHLAVAGPSGIGKSTLLALIAGVLRPDAGEVLRGPDRVLVPQEAYVFTATVRENLGYFCTQLPDDSALLASVEAVGAGPLTDRLGGLDAVLDPAALSAGERQLVALARSSSTRRPAISTRWPRRAPSGRSPRSPDAPSWSSPTAPARPAARTAYC
jgi:ATP-binding cassette subfamily C protein